jgi:hypothetical protein
MIKQEVLQEVANDNDMSLDLAKVLELQQSAVFAGIRRRSKKFIHDIRVIEFLKSKGFTDEQIFEKSKK